MPARKPEECDTILVDAINKGDLEAAWRYTSRTPDSSRNPEKWSPAIRQSAKKLRVSWR